MSKDKPSSKPGDKARDWQPRYIAIPAAIGPVKADSVKRAYEACSDRYKNIKGVIDRIACRAFDYVELAAIEGEQGSAPWTVVGSLTQALTLLEEIETYLNTE